MQVVIISVESDSDAYMIFETLNDRGADLTTADLLKNFIFSRSGERLEENKNNWTTLLVNLGADTSGGEIFNIFARHYLSSIHGLVREKRMYQIFKSNIISEQDSINFMKSLVNASRLYTAIDDPEHEYWNSKPKHISDAIETLNLLNIDRYKPMTLAVLEKFDNREIEKYIKSLVSWTIRMLAAHKLNGSVPETAFCEAASKIKSGQINSVDELISYKRISDLISSDKQFEEDFSKWYTTAKISRYVLRTLENKKYESENGDNPELVPSSDVDLVNLEHILPKKDIDGSWSHFSAEEKREYIGRIGNHALLSKNKNGKIGSKSWSEKKEIFKESEINLTKELSTYRSWTKEEIGSRQAELAKLAVIAWPR